MNRGFTVVEILVTLVVMAVLLGLGVVGLRASLANGRDAERKTDIESIARSLEQRYDRGNKYTFDADTDYDGSTPKQTLVRNWAAYTYPGDSEMWDYLVWNSSPPSETLPNISAATLTSPSGEKLNGICFFAWADLPRCDTAEKDSNVQEAFADDNGGYKDRYMFESINQNNNYCNADCIRYNIYWISETDKTIYKGIPGLKVWKSRHQ